VLTGKLTLARKGTFLGGYSPYGCDVVAFNAEGKEVWRVVYEGHDRRLKVYPDGRQERFDGKRNRPPKALHETLKYRPSLVAERVKYVKLIFKWYTTESITAGQIAARLNDLGVSPVFGPLWHQGVVKYLLANPVYVGRPTYNKQSNSRFMEFSNGQVKTAERKPSRKRAEADHIRPEKQEFKPMIDPDVFDKAQAKLDAATATNLDEARPLLDAIHDAKVGRNGVWLDMLGFVDAHFRGSKARRKTRMSVQELYGSLYERAKPELEKKVADKEAEIESVLDGFAGLTSKMKDRVNIRLEALQAELDALRADLRDSRLSWDYFTDQLTARKEALDRATATLNQEGQARQKCEVLKTVVDKIVCHFRRVGKHATLDSIDVIPAEDAAVRPLTFPAASLLEDSCLGALA